MSEKYAIIAVGHQGGGRTGKITKVLAVKDSQFRLLTIKKALAILKDWTNKDKPDPLTSIVSIAIDNKGKALPAATVIPKKAKAARLTMK